MQFEYDPERLIEEVKKRPAIWDFEDPEYRAKNLRHKVWNDVVRELMAPDVKVTKGEMRELEMQLQKKWKSIRDCFQKYMTNPNRTKRPYIYMKHLKFLLKNQEVSKVADDNDNASDESDEKPRKVWKSKKKCEMKIAKEETSEEDTHNYDNFEDSREYSYVEVESTRPAKVAKTSRSQVDDFVFANVDTPAKTDADDADKMFLLSLLPHLKTIPEEFRLNVKLELMQVLRNANYSTAQDHKII